MHLSDVLHEDVFLGFLDWLLVGAAVLEVFVAHRYLAGLNDDRIEVARSFLAVRLFVPLQVPLLVDADPEVPLVQLAGGDGAVDGVGAVVLFVEDLVAQREDGELLLVVVPLLGEAEDPVLLDRLVESVGRDSTPYGPPERLAADVDHDVVDGVDNLDPHVGLLGLLALVPDDVFDPRGHIRVPPAVVVHVFVVRLVVRAP